MEQRLNESTTSKLHDSSSRSNCEVYNGYKTQETSWFWKNLPFWSRAKLIYNAMTSSSNESHSLREDSKHTMPHCRTTRPTSLMTSYSKSNDETFIKIKASDCNENNRVIEEDDEDVDDDINERTHLRHGEDRRITSTSRPLAKPEESIPGRSNYEPQMARKLSVEYKTQSAHKPRSNSKQIKHLADRELNLWSLRKSLEADSFRCTKPAANTADCTPDGLGDCSPCSTSSSERLRSDILTSDDDVSNDERRQSTSTDNGSSSDLLSQKYPLYPSYSVESQEKLSVSSSGIQGSLGSTSSGSVVFPPPSSNRTKPKKLHRQKNIEEHKHHSGPEESITGSSSLRSFTRIFRRSSLKSKQSPSLTFCGYSLERDYCVDVETDKIFKEYLRMDSVETPLPPVNPRRLRRCKDDVTQLRRQVMKKQYSDSIAMYYGQRMRRWRAVKQRSDSVNCPVDRGVLRRQAGVEEEFVPSEINERRMLPPTRYDSLQEDRDFVFDDLQRNNEPPAST